ncbi:MFS transporter [Ostreiculturibacter nitratireducens]|uniref:MFS transporter n=1 Tax=Ostreiculturibacter nitratireducens TaxID=3075226 RepID=UPI0031B63A0C
MKTGIAFLVAGYVLSQFYRAFLAVLTPVLGAEIGAGPEALARASGLWFLAFALMQIPVGAALDRIGPRRTASVLLAIGGAGGATIFALAEGPLAVQAAMVLIGIGCSPVLMASYVIFARMFRPAVFGTLAGAMIGAGSLGNILGAAPLAWTVEAVGWRETLFGLAGVTLVVALALYRFVQDPPPVVLTGEETKATLLDLLKVPGLWAILPLMAVSYAPAAALRGLWSGPYAERVFGADVTVIGTVTLAMGLAMVAGNFAYGPLDRVFGTRKWVVFWGNTLAATCLAGLWLFPASGLGTATALLAGVAIFGSSFPMIMAHARGFFPAQLVGRGVTFLNMFGIGGAGIMQFASGRVYNAAAVGAATPEAPFALLFLFFLVPLILGLALYLFSRDAPH